MNGRLKLRLESAESNKWSASILSCNDTSLTAADRYEINIRDPQGHLPALITIFSHMRALEYVEPGRCSADDDARELFMPPDLFDLFLAHMYKHQL